MGLGARKSMGLGAQKAIGLAALGGLGARLGLWARLGAKGETARTGWSCRAEEIGATGISTEAPPFTRGTTGQRCCAEDTCDKKGISTSCRDTVREAAMDCCWDGTGHSPKGGGPLADATLIAEVRGLRRLVLKL